MYFRLQFYGCICIYVYSFMLYNVILQGLSMFSTIYLVVSVFKYYKRSGFIEVERYLKMSKCKILQELLNKI